MGPLVASPPVRVLDVAPSPVFPARRGMTVRIAALGRELSRRHHVRHLTLAAERPGRRRGVTGHQVSSSHEELHRIHPLSSLVMRVSAGSWHELPFWEASR